MDKLAHHVINGAEFDSSARDPPPRCHEHTRETLAARIQGWFHDQQRGKKLLWLNGPAGVGKSAIMQTLAETDTERLGATLFFSRLNQRDDPDKVVPTIAYQLAVRIPSYRAFIVERLGSDPLLLDRNIRIQFQKLIVEPFATEGLHPLEGTRYMLIDGLDECQSEDAQCDIIQLISEFVLRFPAAPFLWIIASRPEDRLKQEFSRSTIIPSYWQLYVPIDDDEARGDVRRFMWTGFEEIRRKYPDATSPNWPSEADFIKIANTASGLFIFASTVILFVKNPNNEDPVSQLQVILSVIDNSTPCPLDNPFATLDALYTRILSGINSSILPIVQQLLGHLILRGGMLSLTNRGISLFYSLIMVSNILGLKRNSVYGALRRLHSVLYIPPQDRAHEQHIQFLHASFPDYLKDSKRSERFAIDLDMVAKNLLLRYHRIRWEANSNPGQFAIESLVPFLTIGQVNHFLILHELAYLGPCVILWGKIIRHR